MKLALIKRQIGPEDEVIKRMDFVRMPKSYDGPPIFKPSTKNVKAILQHDSRWKGRIWKNDFTGLVMLEPKNGNTDLLLKCRSWSEDDGLDVLDFVQVHYGIDPRLNTCITAVDLVSTRQEVRRHPLREYLDDCVAEWDGKPRLDSWMFDFLGVEKTMGGKDCQELLSVVGRKWMIGAVARARYDGVKMDNVLILKGTQGTGKSTAFSILGGEYFSDSNIDLKSKDAYQSIIGCWIVEFAELDSMKRSQATAIKAFLSSSKDRFRPSYGSKVIEVPRHTVFCGTTNDQEFLIDTTGNRRFWPVETHQIDLKGLAQARDHLWAEACIALDASENWYLDGDLEAQYSDLRLGYVQGHPWDGLIETHIADRILPIHVNDLLENAIGKEKGSWHRGDQQTVSNILKGLGWTPIRQEGERRWAPPKP